MSNEPISQAEIDALLKGNGPAAASPAPVAGEGGPVDLELLRSVAAPAVEGAWAVAEALLGQPAEVTELKVSAVPTREATQAFGPDLIYGRVNMAQFGSVYALMDQSLALQLIGLMLGGAAPAELTATGAAALAEAIGQLVTKGVVKLAGQAGQSIIPSPVEVIPAAAAPAAGLPGPDDTVILLMHEVSLGETAGPVGVLLPAEMARTIAEGLRAAQAPPPPAAPPMVPQPQSAPPMAASPAPVAAGAGPTGGYGMAAGAPAAAVMAVAPVSAPPAAQVAYQPHQFPELQPAAPAVEPRNIDLLLDVNLQVTVELGRTRKQIRDVLSLGPGSVIELEKLAGEPVDVLVNGKLIAKGEVVVIDEHFGVRITDIVSAAERAASLR